MLWIKTTDQEFYTITNDVVKDAGFTIKELMDLLKEYSSSEVLMLYFNADKRSETHLSINKIGPLVMVQTKF